MSNWERVSALLLLAGLLWLELWRPAGADAPFSADQPVNDETYGSQSFPDIAVDGQGRVYVAWQDGRDFDTNDFDIYFSWCGDPLHGEWSTDMLVNDVQSNYQGSPALAVDREGNGYLIWRDSRQGSTDIFSSKWPVGGGGWRANKQVNTQGTYHRSPALAVDNLGSVNATWANLVGPGEYDIHFSRLAGGIGEWSDQPYGRVNDDEGGATQDNPTISVDRSNYIYVVWQDQREDPEGDTYFSWRPTHLDHWSSNRKLNDDGGEGIQSDPAVAVDGEGRILAVWSDQPTITPTIHFAQSSDQGQSWTPSQPLAPTIGGFQKTPNIAVDEAGQVYMVWRQQADEGDGGDIYLARRAPGSEQWSEPLRVNDHEEDASRCNPALAVTPEGMVHVTWADSRGGDSDVYFSWGEFIPPRGSITIAGGADYALSTHVTLTLAATDTSGVAAMHLSSDGLSWEDWEPYTSTRKWILSEGDGAQSVYVEYRDALDNVSSLLSDTITLDTTPPTGTLLINGGAESTGDRRATLSLSASDATSGISAMRFSQDDSSYSDWEPFATTRGWTLSAPEGLQTVWVQYRDGAGNASCPISDTITLALVYRVHLPSITRPWVYRIYLPSIVRPIYKLFLPTVARSLGRVYIPIVLRDWRKPQVGRVYLPLITRSLDRIYTPPLMLKDWGGP